MLRNQGVSIGGGIGSICDIVDAAQMICEKVGLFLPQAICGIDTKLIMMVNEFHIVHTYSFVDAYEFQVILYIGFGFGVTKMTLIILLFSAFVGLVHFSFQEF